MYIIRLLSFRRVVFRVGEIGNGIADSLVCLKHANWPPWILRRAVPVLLNAASAFQFVAARLVIELIDSPLVAIAYRYVQSKLFGSVVGSHVRNGHRGWFAMSL